MSNMAYCRMENTYHDICDCIENWNEAKSESEIKYRQMIIDAADEIVNRFGDDKSERINRIYQGECPFNKR